MPVLNIKDPEAYRLASSIAQATGKSLTRVVLDALRHEKEIVASLRPDLKRAREIIEEIRAIPVRDTRSARDILNDLYDERGLPK